MNIAGLTNLIRGTDGGKGNAGAMRANGSSSGSTISGGYTLQPLHRRQSGYSSTTSGKRINWVDFMPEYDEEDDKYNACGDSFGSIFSDVVNGAAVYVAGVSNKVGDGGEVGELTDFLEQNLDCFESGYEHESWGYGTALPPGWRQRRRQGRRRC